MLQPAAAGASGSAMEVDGADAAVLDKIESKSKELNAVGAAVYCEYVMLLADGCGCLWWMWTHLDS